MHKLMTSVVLLGAFVAIAETQTPKSDAKAAKLEAARVSQSERIAQMGGFVVRPGSMKGSIAFIDTQSKVAIDKPFEEVMGTFKRLIPVKLDLVKAKSDKPEVLKANAKADFAIIFVDEESSPSMTIFPEDGIAVVNFAKYTKGLKLPDDQGLLEKRCAKGGLKAFVMLCNGGGSRYQGHVATAHTPEQLDLAHDKLPIDIQDSIKKYLEAAGVTPMRRAIYRKAVEEGWAPAPTNDVQKAIWDKVHAMPTEPIKIKPETKKVEK